MKNEPIASKSIHRFRLLVTILFWISAIVAGVSLVLYLPNVPWGRDLLLNSTVAKPEQVVVDGLSGVFRVTEVDVQVVATSLIQQLVAYSGIVIGCVVWVSTLFFARRFASQLVDAGSERFWNVRDLVISTNIFLVCFGLSILQNLAQTIVVSQIEGRNQVDNVLTLNLISIDFIPLAAALAVMAFVTVMKHGAKLHEDVERTV